MGYDLHITRARTWTESAGHPITESEWRACVAADPGLDQIGAVLYEGRIVVKNPDEATVSRLIATARLLRAHAEGDDGERYDVAGEPPRPATPSLRDRLGSWFDRFRPPPKVEPVVLPFGVGDQVRDAWGREGRVVAIDTGAQHGLGEVRVRFDDGAELTISAVAHGLTPAAKGRG